MGYKKLRQVKAIEASNKKRLLKVNPKLDDEAGIYMLWRTETHGYVGQSKGILTEKKFICFLSDILQNMDTRRHLKKLPKALAYQKQLCNDI